MHAPRFLVGPPAHESPGATVRGFDYTTPSGRAVYRSDPACAPIKDSFACPTDAQPKDQFESAKHKTIHTALLCVHAAQLVWDMMEVRSVCVYALRPGELCSNQVRHIIIEAMRENDSYHRSPNRSDAYLWPTRQALKHTASMSFAMHVRGSNLGPRPPYYDR